MQKIRVPKIANAAAGNPVNRTTLLKSPLIPPITPVILMPSPNATQGKSIANGRRAGDRRFQDSKEISKASGIDVPEPRICGQTLVTSTAGLEKPAKKNGWTYSVTGTPRQTAFKEWPPSWNTRYMNWTIMNVRNIRTIDRSARNLSAGRWRNSSQNPNRRTRAIGRARPSPKVTWEFMVSSPFDDSLASNALRAGLHANVRWQVANDSPCPKEQNDYPSQLPATA